MKKIALMSVLFALLFISCDKNKDEPQEPTVELNNEINDFVWKGMNQHYYWQEDVANLDDDKDNDLNSYHQYLNGYAKPENLFESLLYQPGTVDRFSWFIEDYEEQNASFRGVNDSYGFEFGLARMSEDSNDVIGYVTYVVPNSPASDADMKRGDIFHVFNGTTLNLDNYRVVNAYYTDNNISMEFATISGDDIVPNGKAASLNIRQVVENPIHYHDIINIGLSKVGYLVYNSFKYTFHKELNQVFGEFKSEGINELILDLRYNGGGTVLTSAYLASMIEGGAGTNEVFAKLIYNSKNSVENDAYPFFNDAYIYDIEGERTGSENINRLNSLSRIYIITTDDTASASEMIINGLSPFMEVIKVGTTTYGKNVGSFTIYDSPDFKKKNVNPNHKNAMQPITFKIFNKLDESDYTLGFEPDIEQIEYASQMKPFGNPNEPLLKRALDNIRGIATRPEELKVPEFGTEVLMHSLDKKPFSKEMYLLPNE